MTQVKESSTQNANKQLNIGACPVSYVMSKIDGHWKPSILYLLMNGPKRYSELKREIPAVTEKMLIQHLKQLQADNLVVRTAEQAMPPVVSYQLSEVGESLTPVLNAMATWGFGQTGR
jgi:DNA-binding HxlR family transcriptional regulator